MISSKTTWIILSSCLVFVGCSKSPHTYTIKGKIPDGDMQGKMLYICDALSGERLDSTRVNYNEFVFTGGFEKSEYGTLEVGENYFIDFIIEPGVVELDLKNRIVSGGKLNIAQQEFHTTLSKFAMKAEKRYYEIQAQLANQISADELQSRMEEVYLLEVLPENKDLYIAYFKANTDNILGVEAISRLASICSPQELDELIVSMDKKYLSHPILQKLITEKKEHQKTALINL